MTALPPDRSHVLSEQRNTDARPLHSLSVRECVHHIQQEDHAVLRAVEEAEPAISKFIEAAEPGFLIGGRLIYVGAGTSGRLGVLDASEAPPTFHVSPDRIIGIIAGGDTALRKSSEGAEDDPNGACAQLEALHLNENDSLIGIAAGGTTPFARGAVQWTAQQSDATTGFLSCSPIESPHPHCHLMIAATGPEVLTGSTRMKAGTATKLILNTISTTLMVRSGRVYENLMIDMRATNNKLCDRAARIISNLTHLPRAEAFDLLQQADGRVKTALIMFATGNSQAEATTMIESDPQAVRRCLDEALSGKKPPCI